MCESHGAAEGVTGSGSDTEMSRRKVKCLRMFRHISDIQTEGGLPTVSA